MNKSLFFILILFQMTTCLISQESAIPAENQNQNAQAQNLELLSNWTTGSRPYNDVWGYVDSNGDEVAIIGSRSHYYFVDISDPENPELIDGFEGGTVTIWRDMKTYGQWAYGVCDSCNEGLSIFKLGDSPKSNGVQLVNQTTSFFSRAHNIYIDEQHGRLYAIGTDTQRNGVIIFDIKTNPEEPILLSAINVPGGYMHDLFVRNHIGYGNSEGRGLYVYNFSNPTNPQTLGTLNSYPQQGYNHSGWLNPAGDVLIMADETHNTSLKAVDVSDLSDIEVTSLFRSELLAPGATGSIAHNPFVRDNFAVVSYYHDGVQVFDISDPANVQQVAWYDTFPNNTNYNGFSGCWGAYPFLPSGNILGSDGTNGLFVLRPTQFTFTPIPPVQPPFAFINETIESCVEPGTAISLSLTTDAETIQWFRNGAQVGVGDTFTATSEGTYFAIVYKGPHSLILDPVEIVFGEAPDVTLNAPAEFSICEGENFDLMVPAGAESYEWFVDGSPVFAAGNSLTVFVEGSYTVTAVNEGCEATSTPVQVSIVSLPEAILNQTGVMTLCEGEAFTLSTNSEGESYQWFSGFDQPIDGANMSTLVVTEPDQYRVEVANGQCVASSEFVVIEFTEAPEVIFNTVTNTSFCEGESFTLSVETEGEEYEFSNGNGVLQVGASNSFEVTEAGEYTVQIFTETCSSASSITFNTIAQPTSIISTDNDPTICDGESITLTSTNEADSYQWFFNGLAIDDADAPEFVAFESGVYTLELSNGMCSDLSAPFDLGVVVTPTITLGSEEEVTICLGESTTLVLEGQADSYTWTLTDGTTLIGATLEVTESGTFVGQAGNGNCFSNEVIVNVEVIIPANLNIQAADAVICDGESTVLTAITDTGDFVWIRNGQVIAQAQTSLDINEPGVYSIETSAAQCFSDSPDIVISQGQAANATIMPLTDTELCQGETGVLELPAGFAEYVWSLNGSTLPETSNRLEVGEPGNYIGTVISVDGCQATSEPFALIFNPLPDATLDLENTVNICSDEEQILEAPQEADSYAWSLNGQVISNEPSITATQSGIYQLELMEDNCVGLSQEITLNVTENPMPELNVTGQIDICEGEEFRLIATNTFGDYHWFRNGDLINDANVNFIEVAQPGMYTVEAFTGSCSGVSNAVSIEVLDLPIAAIIGEAEQSLCAGETLTLESGLEADEYIWTLDIDPAFSASGPSVEVSQPGIITLTTKVNGCESLPTTVAVTITELPDISALSEDITLCGDESNIVEAPQGADTYRWFRDGEIIAQGEPMLDIDMPGTYVLEIEFNDCVATSNEFTVDHIDLPVVDDGSVIDVDVCFGDRGQLMTSLDSVQVDWFLNGEFFTTDFNILLLEPGIYHFEYSIGPCSARSPDFNVTITELPDLDNLPELIQLCSGEERVLTGPDGVDSYDWTRDGEIISSEQELIITEEGTYQLQINLDNCFKVSSEIAVELITFEGLEDLPEELELCNDEEITIVGPEGMDTYTWFLDGQVIPNSTSNQLTISEAGIYTLEISLNGCSAQSQEIFVEVTEIFPLDDAIDILIPNIVCGDGSIFINLSGYESITLFLDGEQVLTNTIGIVEFTESGVYTLVGRVGSCTTTSDEFEIMFIDDPIAELPQAQYSICPGDFATLEAIGDPNLIYQWRDNNNTFIGMGMSIEVAEPGIYTLEVIDGNTGCDISLEVEVIQYDLVTPIIEVDGLNLTSSEAQSYQWYLDGQAIPDATGITYEATASGDYQVEIVDANGCSAFSEVISIEISSVAGITQLDQFDLYPNPVHDQLTLSLSTTAYLDLDINVYNQLGQRLITQSIAQSGVKQYPISVANLSSGLYYLTLVSDTGGVETQRFVKE